MELPLFQLKKRDFDAFVAALAADREVFAPVRSDVVRFERVTDAARIDLTENAYFPLKEFFFRKQETLVRFRGLSVSSDPAPAPPRAFVGVRRCDLAAVRHQDVAFGPPHADPFYAAARQNALFVGYHCPAAPSPFCFCGSLGLEEFHDLMLFDRPDEFWVQVGSDAGARLVAAHPSLFIKTKHYAAELDLVIPGADRLEHKDLSALYDRPEWKEGVDLCLSCAACTALCPTCYCFEIHDDVSLKDPAEGARCREWSSCQLPSFTRVAGDHVFRKDLAERFKHRIYHQLQYFREQHGVNLCTGCGRCISGCPTRIDFVSILNKMPSP